MNKDLRSLLESERSVQGLNSVPLFLGVCAYSGMTMKKFLGFSYTRFLFDYINDYGEGQYLKKDFIRLWKLIKGKLDKDPNYLKKLKRIYENQIRTHKPFVEKLKKTNFGKISDEELLRLFKEYFWAQVDFIGLAHMIEPIGVECEKEFRELLYSEIKDKENFNKYFIALTEPSQLSFVAREEDELRKIFKKGKNERKKLLKRHLEKYSWIGNTYAGPKELSAGWFEDRMKSLPAAKNKKIDKKAKPKLIKTLNLSKKIVKLVNIIDFTTIWQDERKENILKAIGYSAEILKEVEKKIKVPVQELCYLGVQDILKLKDLAEIKKIKKELKARRAGSFFIMEGLDKEIILTGKDYKQGIAYQKRMAKDESEKNLTGSIANIGTAIGQVKVCKYLHNIDKVRKGDILVTSMTRPEFMPAPNSCPP